MAVRMRGVRAGICQDAINLFRHGAVVAAEAGLDMDNRYIFLRCHQGTGNGGIDIADYQHGRGLFLIEYRLKSPHDLGCLNGMAGRTDAQIHVRHGDTKLRKEGVFHLGIVMLPGRQ